MNMKTSITMRNLFVAPPGYVWLSCDFSSQELLCVAALANEPNMLSTFMRKKWNPYIKDENGEDIKDPYTDLHYVAAESIKPSLKDLPISQRKDAAEEKLPELGNKSPRASAKVLNFGLIYGLTASSLASDMGWELSEAENILESYFNKFSKLKSWLDFQGTLGKERKWVRTASGRLCFTAESNAKGIDDANAYGRKATNCLVQGACSDMMKMALRKIHPFAKKNGCKLVSVVHDECNLLVPGKWWIEDQYEDEKGNTQYKFGFCEESQKLGKHIISLMEEAESELLLPLIEGDRFPSMADMALAPYWKH